VFGRHPLPRSFKYLLTVGLVLWFVGLLSFPLLKDFTLVGGIPSTLLYMWCLQVAMWVVAVLGIVVWLRGGP